MLPNGEHLHLHLHLEISGIPVFTAALEARGVKLVKNLR